MKKQSLFLVVLAAMSLGACSTLSSGQSNQVVTQQAEALADQQQRVREMQFVITELRTENARLSRTIQSLEQSQQVAEKKAASLQPQAEQKAIEQAQNSEPQVLVVPPPPKSPQTIIVADAEPLTSEAVTVERTPRLVEPSFTAVGAVFENEAGPNIQTSSVLFGVHLASYRKTAEAITGWRKLQRNNPDLLGLLEPRIEKVTIEGRGEFIRLIAGGFSSKDKALSLCETLKKKKTYCASTNFNGERLEIPSAG